MRYDLGRKCITRPARPRRQTSVRLPCAGGWAAGRTRGRAMRFRVVTLNLEQDHKRWEARRPLIAEEIGRLRPDILAFNEVSVPLQTARGLGKTAAALTGVAYNLVQQTRVNGLSKVEGEAMLTRFSVI